MSSSLSSFFPSVEESYQRLLAHLPGMAYRCRVDKVLENNGMRHFEYKLEFVSEGSYELLGISASDMVGRGQNVIERMTNPDDLEKQRNTVYEAVNEKQPYQVMYRMKLPGNVTKWIWDQGEGVYGPDGELWYLEGLMMDVSEQKFKELSLREENRQLRSSASSLFGLGGLMGQSEAMRRMYERIIKAAETDTTVIIYGETGSGKDVTARAIHSLSGGNGPYVPVNCGAIPRELIESELFGYESGAFTGAKRGGSPGKFELANGGTILLDEIGDMPLDMQVKLLRVLQEKEVWRVGASAPIKLDVRVMASTNKDLLQMVRDGAFRQDLYYRLNVVRIVIPPLRERKEDIPLLVDTFISQMNIRLGLDIQGIQRQALELLMDYDWPGNVRELQNAVERAMNYAYEGILMPSHFRFIQNPSSPERSSLSASQFQQSFHHPGNYPLYDHQETESERIQRALSLCGGNKSAAAKSLGWARSTLYEKLKKHENLR